MLIASFFIQFTAFYILYSTSKRAAYAKRTVNIWLEQHSVLAKSLGCFLLAASFVMFMIQFGIGVGSLFALASIMTISGFTIILYPLRKDHKTSSR